MSTASPATIAAGSTSENIVITVNDDTLDELDETVVVTLTGTALAFDEVNKTFFGVAIKGYDTVAPKGVKFAVTNFFWNLEQPTYIVNHLLQGKPLPALRQTGRFVINSTLGLAGIIDAAKDANLPREPEDFGQTFAVDEDNLAVDSLGVLHCPRAEA